MSATEDFQRLTIERDALRNSLSLLQASARVVLPLLPIQQRDYLETAVTVTELVAEDRKAPPPLRHICQHGIDIACAACRPACICRHGSGDPDCKACN